MDRINLKSALSILMVLFLLTGFRSAVATPCPGKTQIVTGTVYCDNQFILWVNGEKIATDPIVFTPHQAVSVSFEWDGTICSRPRSTNMGRFRIDYNCNIGTDRDESMLEALLLSIV